MRQETKIWFEGKNDFKQVTRVVDRINKQQLFI